MSEKSWSQATKVDGFDDSLAGGNKRPRIIITTRQPSEGRWNNMAGTFALVFDCVQIQKSVDLVRRDATQSDSLRKEGVRAHEDAS